MHRLRESIRNKTCWLAALISTLVALMAIPPHSTLSAAHGGVSGVRFALFASTLDGVVLRTDGTPAWRRVWKAPVRPQDAGDVNPIWSLAGAYDGHTLYAGAYDGTFWRSTDAGLHWRHTAGALPATYDSVEALAVSPNSAKTVYAGALDGLFETTDGGTHWHKLAAGQDVPRFLDSGITDITAIAIDAQHPLSIWAGRGGTDGIGGLYHSADGGRTWRREAEGLPRATAINCIAVAPASTVFVVSSNTVYRSRDGGAHWSRLARGLPAPATRGLYESFPPVLAVSPVQPKQVYVGLVADTPQHDFGLYVTADAGALWRRSQNGFHVGESVTQVVADPTNARMAYIGTTDRVLRSTDGGTTWKPWQDAVLTTALAGGAQVYDMIGMSIAGGPH